MANVTTLRHGGMVHQHGIDLQRADLLAAAIDDFLEPAGQPQIAVRVDRPLVAGAEPAVGEALRWRRDCSHNRAVTLRPRITTSPSSPAAGCCHPSSMMAISGPAAMPTEPG